MNVGTAGNMCFRVIWCRLTWIDLEEGLMQQTLKTRRNRREVNQVIVSMNVRTAGNMCFRVIWCQLTWVDLEEGLIWCRLTSVDLVSAHLG